MPGKQTVPRAELWGANQILSKVDGKSNIQIPIDAKYVTRGIAHRGDLVQGPKVLFQLIDERCDVVAEEAAKRLLPDLNLERKAKWAERVGVGVAKRLAFGASGHLGQEKRSWRHLRTRPSVSGRNNMHADRFQHAG